MEGAGEGEGLPLVGDGGQVQVDLRVRLQRGGQLVQQGLELLAAVFMGASSG